MRRIRVYSVRLVPLSNRTERLIVSDLGGGGGQWNHSHTCRVEIHQLLQSTAPFTMRRGRVY